MASSSPSSDPLSMIPLNRPPPGVQALDMSRHAPMETAVIVVPILFTIKATIFVTCRVWLNARTEGRKFGWDDVSCVLSLILCIISTALVISLKKYSRYPWDFPMSWLNESYYHKGIYICGVLSGPMLFFSKLSLLLLFLRLFSPDKSTRWALYAAIIGAFCVYFMTIPVLSYYCTPSPGRLWDISLGPKCAKIIVTAPVQGILNVVLDLFILITPIATITRLKLSRQKKLGVLAVFTTGFLAVIASVVGMVYRIILYQSRSTAGIYTWFAITICMIAEADISLICASIPAVASLSKHPLPPSSFPARILQWLLSSVPLTKTSRLFGTNSDKSSNRNSARDDPAYTYGMDEPQISSQGYLQLEEGTVGGRNTTRGYGGGLPPDFHDQSIIKSVHIRQVVETTR